jgi:pimeloyl-ACP methyl ester carboxylesterase
LKAIAETVTSADGTTIGYQTLGAGEGVIVVGGSLSSARNYMRLAERIGRSFTVHVLERRGRGASGPQGIGYGIETECADLLSVQRRTGATAAFGHSYGGLVCLEAARRSAAFTRLAVFEPGVSVDGCIPGSWIVGYRELLAKGKGRAAFAYMVKEARFAPAIVSKLPLWYLRAVLRFAIGRDRWKEMEPLLAAHAAEHEQVVRLDNTVDAYRAVGARVLLLGGSKSPAAITRRGLDALHGVISGSTLEILDGVGHLAPDDEAPERVAERLVRHFEAG